MITKVEIVRMLYEEFDKKIPMKTYDLIIDKVFDYISDQIKSGEKIHISNFGTFSSNTTFIKKTYKIINR